MEVPSEEFEDESEVEAEFAEIPGYLSGDDIPAPASVVTPIEQFTRLGTIAVSNTDIGGFRYGNSVSGELNGSVTYYANLTPFLEDVGEQYEFMYEATFKSPIDRDKVNITSSNEPRGFYVGSSRTGDMGTGLVYTKVDGINYVDDYTFRVSVIRKLDNYANLWMTASCRDGLTINIYVRKLTSFASNGGDGNGGSDGGGAAT